MGSQYGVQQVGNGWVVVGIEVDEDGRRHIVEMFTTPVSWDEALDLRRLYNYEYWLPRVGEIANKWLEKRERRAVA